MGRESRTEKIERRAGVDLVEDVVHCQLSISSRVVIKKWYLEKQDWIWRKKKPTRLDMKTCW